MSKSIYLAGPITGLNHANSVNWRKQFSDLMQSTGVECFSPMRGKDYLARLEVIEHSYPDSILSNQRAIITRDRYDCTHCKLIVMNLMRDAAAAGQKPSLGTVMELAWADLSRIPVIAIIEKDVTGSPYNHPMILEAIGFQVETIEQTLPGMQKFIRPGAGEMKDFDMWLLQPVGASRSK
jgi:nucleoside 2-deoxyribosyltransferase